MLPRVDFAFNSAGYGGGAALGHQATGRVCSQRNPHSLTLANFSQNSAVNAGGAISAFQVALTLQQANFTANVVTGAGGMGGALWAAAGSVTVASSTFQGNLARECCIGPLALRLLGPCLGNCGRLRVVAAVVK